MQRKHGRVIRLSEGGRDSRVLRFISGLPKALAESLTGDAPKSWVTVTRTGTFYDRRYGQFDITRAMLAEMVANFEAGTYGQEIFFDVSHEPDKGAAAKLIKLAIEGDRLRALVEWTPYGVDAVKGRGFRYLSAEFDENWQDNEKRATHGCVLLGAGLTIRPVIKRLDPVSLSEQSEGDGAAILLHPTLLSELINEVKNTMNKHLEELKKQLAAKGLSEAAISAALKLAEQAMAGMTDDAAMKTLCDAFAANAKQLSEAGAGATITLNGMNAEDVNAAVAKALAERDNQSKKLAESLEGKRKLLADTIAEIGKSLSEDSRKELTADIVGVVSPEMSDGAIKSLAEAQVKLAERAEANKQLAAVGWNVRGNAHITVDDSNTVKALQEKIDQRLGIETPKDSKNEKFIAKVLAEFDARHAAALRQEHKMLAGGDGIISDVSVPAIFERTTIRQALYPLMALQFVNTDTYEFGNSAVIPYSYRDTTAAGRDSTRKYEGQGIARAGMIQTSDTAYPIPQKLAFEVSDELRYLTAANRINYDAVVENVSNASRIINEDLERLILNEMVNASDEFAVTTVATETLTSSVDGTKKVFPLANFPVVKPRKIFDLQGNQVGSTTNPITVTLNSVARLEYDGTGTQSAGTYWTMDYNLGELRFVDQTGASVTPTSGWALVVGYGYTTNVAKWDTDLGSLAAGAKWDDFLYRYGLRRAVLKQQRFYRPDFGLMSSTVHEMVLLADQFQESKSKGQTTVNGDGDLGMVRGIPNFEPYAPGIQLADTRVLIGERGNTRFRMMKPWQMGQMQDQRDSNGRFTGKKEAYGDQFIVLHTPAPLKGCNTSIVLYSATGRVAR